MAEKTYRYFFRSKEGVENDMDEAEFFRLVWKSAHLDKSIALTVLGVGGVVHTTKGEYRRETLKVASHA